MRHSFFAFIALLLPPQTMIVQACDTTAQGIVDLERESESFCHPWPGCTSWTMNDTMRVADLRKAKMAAAKSDSIDVLVGEYDLANQEFVRIHLDQGQIYRVEFTARNGNLQIRPRRSYEQAALPLTIEDIPRASGTRAIEIAPRQDGEYDFRVIGSSGSTARLSIFREVRPSERWRRISSPAEGAKPGA
jgi:hypothetical protein